MWADQAVAYRDVPPSRTTKTWLLPAFSSFRYRKYSGLDRRQPKRECVQNVRCCRGPDCEQPDARCRFASARRGRFGNSPHQGDAIAVVRVWSDHRRDGIAVSRVQTGSRSLKRFFGRRTVRCFIWGVVSGLALSLAEVLLAYSIQAVLFLTQSAPLGRLSLPVWIQELAPSALFGMLLACGAFRAGLAGLSNYLRYLSLEYFLHHQRNQILDWALTSPSSSGNRIAALHAHLPNAANAVSMIQAASSALVSSLCVFAFLLKLSAQLTLLLTGVLGGAVDPAGPPSPPSTSGRAHERADQWREHDPVQHQHQEPAAVADLRHGRAGKARARERARDDARGIRRRFQRRSSVAMTHTSADACGRTDHVDHLDQSFAARTQSGAADQLLLSTVQVSPAAAFDRAEPRDRRLRACPRGRAVHVVA